MSQVDCNLLMRQILKNLEAAIREKNAVIKHDALPTVVANSSQLQQVLQNLVNNAIKFHGRQSAENRSSSGTKRDGVGIFRER